jgi:uncharacterized protein (DUF2225 family)
MNVLSGLEKYFKQKVEAVDIYENDEVEEAGEPALRRKKADTSGKTDKVPSEEEFLLEKSFTCPVCQNTFRSPVLKTSRARRLQPDQDLRPNFANIDANKYDVSCCPKCGYSALNRNFATLSTLQVKLLKEGIESIFSPEAVKFADSKVFSYETAIDRYKLALFNSLVKKGRDSEKAFICLKLSWLYRGWLEKMDGESGVDEKVKASCEKCERLYYEKAYEGFVNAIARENPPICNMDESTLDLLMGSMAYRLQKYEQASHFISSVLGSKVASKNAKDRAFDLKELIIEELHNTKA